MEGSCILLNADYSFLNTVNWKKAILLLSKGRVEVLKFSKRVIRSAEGVVMKVPSVLRLVKLIRILYKTKVPFSKKNVMTRDGYECLFCGSKANLTIDHVIPKTNGGKSTFENCVTACYSCNNAKGGRSPREAGMTLKRQPYAPTISEFLRIKVRHSGIEDVLNDLFKGE